MFSLPRRIACHSIAAGFAFLIITPVTWMAVDRQQPFDTRNGSTVPAQLIPGEDYALRWEKRDLRYGCEGMIYRTTIDSEGVQWVTEPQPSLLADFPTKERWEVAIGRVRKLPSNSRVGEMRILTRGEFRCNLLQRLLDWPIVVNFPDIYTTVLPPPPRLY